VPDPRITTHAQRMSFLYSQIYTIDSIFLLVLSRQFTLPKSDPPQKIMLYEGSGTFPDYLVNRVPKKLPCKEKNCSKIEK